MSAPFVFAVSTTGSPRITTMSKFSFSALLILSSAEAMCDHDVIFSPSIERMLSPANRPALCAMLPDAMLSMTGLVRIRINCPPLFMLRSPRVSGMLTATSLPLRRTVTSLASHTLRNMFVPRTLSRYSSCASSPSNFIILSPS